MTRRNRRKRNRRNRRNQEIRMQYFLSGFLVSAALAVNVIFLIVNA